MRICLVQHKSQVFCGWRRKMQVQLWTRQNSTELLLCWPGDLSDGVKALEILLGLAGFAWRAIISSMVTSFLLFAILLEVIATTIEALDIRRDRSFLSSTQRC